MNLTAVQIQENWNTFIGNIETFISSPRKEKLIEFYEKYQDRIIMMPASHKKEYHNAFPGGYVDHVNRVLNCAISLANVWAEYKADMSTFTMEELIFSAINHDLGKIGDENHEAYITQTDQWRKEKLGEDYKYNTQLAFASVPDRSLYLLQSNNIKYSFNEMVAIQTHDGLYDEGNKKYLMTYPPEQKPRTCMPFILHQADLMASRIEFELEWLSNLNKPQKQLLQEKVEPKKSVKTKALGTIQSESLKNMLNSL